MFGSGDGDGFVVDDAGRSYWGRHGAAGLLLRGRLDGVPVVLLQHRAPWSHQGGTWALPGGARDSAESAQDAAKREAHEEAGLTDDHMTMSEVEIESARVEARDLATGKPVTWTYTTVVAEAVVTDGALPKPVPNRESADLQWVAEDEVAGLKLHPGFADSWERVRSEMGKLLD
ncbi:MAG: NUDIX domain-containing protein [Mycobacterium sp.]